MIRSRVMSKSLIMSEMVGDHILEKSKDLSDSQNSKNSWRKASIYCNWEVRSVAFPLIDDRKSPKEMVFCALGLEHIEPHPVISEKTTWLFLTPFLQPTV